jgi:hypothetical protein
MILSIASSFALCVRNASSNALMRSAVSLSLFAARPSMLVGFFNVSVNAV